MIPTAGSVRAREALHASLTGTHSVFLYRAVRRVACAVLRSVGGQSRRRRMIAAKRKRMTPVSISANSWASPPVGIGQAFLGWSDESSESVRRVGCGWIETAWLEFPE